MVIWLNRAVKRVIDGAEEYVPVSDPDIWINTDKIMTFRDHCVELDGGERLTVMETAKEIVGRYDEEFIFFKELLKNAIWVKPEEPARKEG